jgi:hypothetical protein
MIEILEHSSSSYAPRTWANAADADVTIALAVDYNTAGERLTHKAAGDKYLKLDLQDSEIVNARNLWRVVHKIENPVINVAGNGINTVVKHGCNQDKINWYVYSMLGLVHKHYPISKIISGGQTGVDISGGWAAVKLGVDCTITLPKGFLQRHEDGKDVTHTREEILAQLYT